MSLRFWFPALMGLSLAIQTGAAQPGSKAQLLGGVIPGCAPKSPIGIDLASPETLSINCRGKVFQIPYRRIDLLEYGQNVSRRYAAAVMLSPVLLLSKERKHYVTLGYQDADGHQQVLVMRVDKGDIRAVLSGLEARTGRRVEFQDEQARASGNG